MKKIYLDYNATTPIDKEVADAMLPYLYKHFGNPSSSHFIGHKSKKAITKARIQIANLINCNPEEIVFTSCCTESNNLAIKGYIQANKGKGNHIITSKIEHPSIMQVCRYLEKHGYKITYIPVNKKGIISTNEIKNAIKSDTILISIMLANNEIGTIQPLKDVVKLARKNNIAVHTDAAQAIGKIDCDVKNLRVDLMSIAGHKFYAPKGIGALYIKNGTNIEKLMHGANQENNLRPGTENISHIVGLGKAAEIAKRDFLTNIEQMQKSRDTIEKEILAKIPSSCVNGDRNNRLPNTLNISLPAIQAAHFINSLTDIAISAGSACHSGQLKPSYVLKAMHLSDKRALGALRISTGKYTQLKEAELAAEMLIKKYQSQISK